MHRSTARSTALIASIFTLLLSLPANAAEWWVDPASAPGGSGASAGDPFVEVDEALAAAAAGDTIRLLPGTHEGPSSWITTANLHITGAPTGAAVLTTPPQIFNHVFDLSSNGVRISRLTFQGHPGAEDTGVVIYGDRGSVVGCDFIDVARPVEIYGFDARILSNDFAGYRANGVHAERGGSRGGATLVARNAFVGSDPITGFATTGVRLSDQGGQLLRVEDNTFEGIPGDGHVAVNLSGGTAQVLRNALLDVDLGISMLGGRRHAVVSNVLDNVELGLLGSTFDTTSTHTVAHNTFLGPGASENGTATALDCRAFTNVRVTNNLVVAYDVGLRGALATDCRVIAAGNVFAVDVDLPIDGDLAPSSSGNQTDIDVVLEADYTPLEPAPMPGVEIPRSRPYLELDLYRTPRATPGTVGAVEQP